jgi:hypothetical protein
MPSLASPAEYDQQEAAVLLRLLSEYMPATDYVELLQAIINRERRRQGIVLEQATTSKFDGLWNVGAAGGCNG